MVAGEVDAGVVERSAVQGLQLLAGGGQDRDPIAARIVFRPPIGQNVNKLIGLDAALLVLAVIDVEVVEVAGVQIDRDARRRERNGLVPLVDSSENSVSIIVRVFEAVGDVDRPGCGGGSESMEG